MKAQHCLRCGGALSAAREDGRLRRKCRRCGWIFYDNPVPAAVAILTRGDQILLARRAAPPYAGTWDLPGGFLERGETPEQGLGRELSEELGVKVRRAELLGFFTETYGRGGFPILAIVYHVRLYGEPRAGSDVSEVGWFPRDCLPFREVGFPSVRAALSAYARRRPRLSAPRRRPRRPAR